MENNKDLYLKCHCSFYVANDNGLLNRKVVAGSWWRDLGIENHLRKLKRLDRKVKNPYIYLDKKTQIVKYFEIKGVSENEKC